MALDPDDPDLIRIIEVANAELERLEAATAKALLEIYERELHAMLFKVSTLESDDTFSARHSQVIVKSLEDAVRRLREDLGRTHLRAVNKALEIGADAGGTEVGKLEGLFGSPAASRALASLSGSIPHRAIVAARELPSFRAITQLATGETRTTLIELDRMTRGVITSGLTQGKSSRQMVPELRRRLEKTWKGKSWELERTLRTGTNAATNAGHNAAYREARELLPDLKRRGHESLGLARKSGGKRENHPFSKFLHGAVTGLEEPWRINIPEVAAEKGLQVPARPLPVMFWRHEGDLVYVGNRYPAHLWERGREVPHREAWEKRRTATVSRPADSMQQAEAADMVNPGTQEHLDTPAAIAGAKAAIEKGVHAKELELISTSEDLKNSILADIDPGILDYLKRKPLKKLTLQPFIETDKGLKAAGLTYRSGEMKIASQVVQQPAKKFAAQQMWNVAEGAKTPLEAAKRTVIHEIGHWFHYSGGEKVTKLIKGSWDTFDDTFQEGKAKPITRYAETTPHEYFAESFSAYVFEREALKAFDPIGYKMVEDVLKALKVQMQG